MSARRLKVALRRVHELPPPDIDALNALGNMLRDRGELEEARSVYERAIAVAPLHAVSHCNLGIALFQLRRLKDAVKSQTRALALKPDHVMAHFSLGTALRHQGRAAEAEVSCQAALAIEPRSVEGLCLLGELRADRGSFAEAEALFRRALDINPDSAVALASIAAHRKMTGNDAGWLLRAQGLLAKPLPYGQEIGLQYAVGKYFDDVGNYEEAFSHYRTANELSKRHRPPHDPAKLAGSIDGIIRRYDAAAIARLQAAGSDSPVPVFIIGMPRSGTSLAEQILASHPAVYGAGELMFWKRAFELIDGAGVEHLDTGATIGTLARKYLQRLTAASGTALRVVDKMPANFLYAGLIHAAFPRARIIHMQRHPLDTCLSIYFQNFFNMGRHANDLDNLADYYRQYLRIMQHWRAVLPAAALLEVSYESLIEDQEGTTRRILEFLGLPWESRCLDFHRTDRVVLTASKWQVRQKITPGSVGRWRHYERFVGALRPLLDPAPRAAR